MKIKVFFFSCHHLYVNISSTVIFMKNYITDNYLYVGIGLKIKLLLKMNNMKQNTFALKLFTNSSNITRLINATSLSEISNNLLLGLYYYFTNEIKTIIISDDLTPEEKFKYKLIVDIYTEIVKETNKRSEIIPKNSADRKRK